jgi:hypothetical protein
VAGGNFRDSRPRAIRSGAEWTGERKREMDCGGLLKTGATFALARNWWTNTSVATGMGEPVVKTHFILQNGGSQMLERCRLQVSGREATPCSRKLRACGFEGSVSGWWLLQPEAVFTSRRIERCCTGVDFCCCEAKYWKAILTAFCNDSRTLQWQSVAHGQLYQRYAQASWESTGSISYSMNVDPTSFTWKTKPNHTQMQCLLLTNLFLFRDLHCYLFSSAGKDCSSRCRTVY